MSTLSPSAIARHAHDAGFRGQALTTAVAVALAESRGNPRAHNATPPDDSYGLWQINMLGALGPDRRRQFDLDSNRELFDPATNAAAAYAISGRGESFRPWTTYTSGAYREHLDEARRAARSMDHRGRAGSGRSDGFRADPDALSGYARRARDVAEDLASVRTRQLRGMRALTDDSFGRIGSDTGFAAAVDRFGESLQRQLRGAGEHADRLARAVSAAARQYREQEADTAHDLLQLLRDK